MKNTPLQGAEAPRFRSELKRGFAASASVLALSLLAQPAVAQVTPETVSNTDDTIVVTGTRQVIQDAIKLKRQATTVVDGLSADEIGEIPALSIGEALEQITSVGSQREGSGATEVSIRGLGPFLGSTVVNGREASNGSGDRSVNFGQFPSELFNKIEVYKTQEASFIEGGVAGQISLSTLKPLEYGKRRVQLQAKGNFQPDNSNIDNNERDIGYRLTGSYVDQWEGNKFGEFGLSIGGQVQRRPNAEQEARSSSTFDGCRVALLDGNSCDDFEDFRQFVDDELDGELPPGFSSFDDDDLDNFSDAEIVDLFRDLQSNEFGVTFGEAFIDDADVQDARVVNPFTGQPFGVTEDVVFTSGTREFRQNTTDDARDSIFAATQWKPNDRLEFNADLQYSDREFSEVRRNILFEANDIEPIGDSAVLDGFELVTASDGSLRRATTTGAVQTNIQESVRSEEYFGIGGSVDFDVTERLRVSVDGSYSDTSRREEQARARISTQSRTTGLEILQNGSEAFQVTLENTNVLDTTLFTGDDVEIQEDLNQFRNNSITAIRGDVEYDLNGGFFSQFKAGIRFSELEYDQLPRVRNELELDDNSDFLDGAFSSQVGGVDVVSTIELDIGTGDERSLANALGLGEEVGFGVLGGGNDLNNDAFEGLTGFVPGTTIPFTIDSNGDFDITATAAQFVELGFADDGDTDTPNESFTNLGALAAAECAQEFPESDFLDGEVNGNLITNIDSDGNVIEAGTGNEFLTFSSLSCLSNALIGRDLVIPGAADASGAELVQSVDINEDTTAVYAQFDFDTELDGLPIRGNFGLRYVDTTLRSNSFRTALTVETDDEGNITGVTGSGNADDLIPVVDEFSYDEFLPSFNLSADITDEVVFRAGVFRALSRPDPSDLGNGRTFALLSLTDNDDGSPVSINDFISNVSANGNPNLEPFTSWNYDLAAEWYPNEDSILAVGAYYKQFSGGFQNSLQTEVFEVNGEDISVAVPVLTTTDERNNIFGVEVNAAHAFTYLPGVLSGLGFKASYNYAASDFEFEDEQFGEAVTLQNGEIVNTRQGFIDPANLPGLSTHTANGQVYFNLGKATFTGVGKFRSSFFQQFITTPGFLRFIDDAFVADARISYKLNNNIKLSLEGTNLLNTARDQFNPTTDSFAEINVFGPRYFAGITAKF